MDMDYSPTTIDRRKWNSNGMCINLIVFLNGQLLQRLVIRYEFRRNQIRVDYYGKKRIVQQYESGKLYIDIQ